MFDGTLHVERNALSFHLLAETLGDIAIKCGQAFLQILYDSHLGTKAIKHRSELHADDTRPDDTEALRQDVELQQTC